MRISHDFSFLLQLSLKGGPHVELYLVGDIQLSGQRNQKKEFHLSQRAWGWGEWGNLEDILRKIQSWKALRILWVTFHVSRAHCWAGMHRTDLRPHRGLHKWSWGRSPHSQRVRQNSQSEPYWVDGLTKQSNKMFPHPPKSQQDQRCYKPIPKLT